MAENDYHIYKAPRPTYHHSSSTHPPSPPLPMRIPIHHTSTTTNSMMASSHSYPAQLANTATPPLPPRNRSMSDHSTSQAPFEALPTIQSPPAHDTTVSPVVAPTKRWWSTSKTLPRFNSMREKRTMPVLPGIWSQMKRRSSDDSAMVMSSTSTPSSLSEERPVQFDLSPTEGDRSFSLLSNYLTLGELVEKHAHSFPFQVKAKQSYSFQASQITILNSDVYNLYFVKKQKVVTMQDKLGSSYTVPVNSAVQFGYINPSDSIARHRSLAYKSFAKVSDLMALSAAEMPKVVCAQKEFKGQSKKSSLEQHEVLLIIQTQRNKLSGKKYLKVYSFLTKSRKTLPAECCAQFTTNPGHLRLRLTDLVEVAPDFFPLQAVIYLEKRFTSSLRDFPSTLLHPESYVTLTEMKTQQTVVASPANDLSSNSLSPPLLDIPVRGSLASLQIEVLSSSQNNDALNTEARKIYEELDISSLQSLEDSATDRAYSTQCLFHTILQKGAERAGMIIVPPVAACQNQMPEETIPDTRMLPDWDQESESEEEHYEKLRDWATSDLQSEGSLVLPYDAQSTSSASPSTSFVSHSLFTPVSVGRMHHYKTLSNSPRDSWLSPHPTSDEDYEVMDAAVHPEGRHFKKETISELRTAVQLLEDRVEIVEKRVPEYFELKSMIKALCSRVESLERHLPSFTNHIASGFETPQTPSTNLAYLQSLDISQVQELLETMNLSQYKEIFHREDVSGEELSKLDEDMLENRLGVKQRLHRKRLMMIINGTKPAQDFLNSDSYVKLRRDYHNM